MTFYELKVCLLAVAEAVQLSIKAKAINYAFKEAVYDENRASYSHTLYNQSHGRSDL